MELVLFDLDGTLVDTAPDLIAATNRVLIQEGREPLPLGRLRPYVSTGARGLIGEAFGLQPGDAGFEDRREDFFREYTAALCVDSRLFDGMEAVLAAIEGSGRRWGIVTNKMARFTDPLVETLGLRARAACVVSGDTTPFAKPHPQPMWHALELAGGRAAEAVYVGDDRRDIEAGKAAGMATLAAAYGYLGGSPDVAGWGADAILESPSALLDWLGFRRDSA